MGIGVHLFFGFIFFTAVTVVLLWVFQIVFLNSFYKTIKINSIHQSARQIVVSLDEDAQMYAAVENAVDKNQMNVLVADGNGVCLAVGLNTRNNVFSELQTWELRALYNDTLSAGGVSYRRYVHGVSQEGGTIVSTSDSMESVLYVYALQTPQGRERLVIVYAGIVPPDSIVETLRIQLVVITVIMVLLSLVLALVISTLISRPIVRMNRSAARLAQGDYDVHFAETGVREVAELAHSLNVAAVELSKVETLRRDLLANVSHDLRTPLTMITGYAEVMRDLPGENTPENVQVIIDEATRLTTLVNDLLDLSKLQSGTVTLTKTVFSLTRCLQDILHRYDRLIDYHFTFSYEDEVFVEADELKITQVV